MLAMPKKKLITRSNWENERFYTADFLSKLNNHDFVLENLLSWLSKVLNTFLLHLYPKNKTKSYYLSENFIVALLKLSSEIVFMEA